MNMRNMAIWAVLCLALAPALIVPAECAERDEKSSEIRIVNVVDDFLLYHKECENADEKTKAEKWDEMLESKHKDFFQHAMYRKKEGDDRKEYKKWCIDKFWKDIAPKMKNIERLNSRVEKQITGTVTTFLRFFPEFKPDTEYYVTISFSFRGKVVDIDGRNVFAIGLEEFDPFGPQVKITIAHDLFHLYHFQFFSTRGAIYRTLWAEGLAVYASSRVVPGWRHSNYLSFTGEKMNRCEDLLPELAADLRKNMSNNDAAYKRIYMGAEDNDTKVPPEAGYYVGLLVVESVAERNSLHKLAKLTPKEVFPIVEAELKRLEKYKKE